MSGIINSAGVRSGIVGSQVVAYGTNANGKYLRFNNGVQICEFTGGSVDSTSALGNIFRSSDLTLTFPIAFSAVPSVISNALESNVYGIWSGVRSRTTSAVTLMKLSGTSSSAGAVSYIAMGVWK